MKIIDECHKIRKYTIKEKERISQFMDTIKKINKKSKTRLFARQFFEA